MTENMSKVYDNTYITALVFNLKLRDHSIFQTRQTALSNRILIFSIILENMFTQYKIS